MTYLYACPRCGFELEVEHAITSPPLELECERCRDGVKLERVIAGAPGFWERHRPNWSGHRMRGRA